MRAGKISILYSAIILVWVITSPSASATPPQIPTQIHVYANIGKHSGLSLKDFYYAVFRDRKLEQAKLIQLGQKRSLEEFSREFQEIIVATRNSCLAQKKTYKHCQEMTGPLELELAEYQNLATSLKDQKNNSTSSEVYWATVVFGSISRHKALKESSERWASRCANNTAINTDNCRRDLAELREINGLISELIEVSRLKSTRKWIEPERDKQIRLGIGKYEKL